MTTINWIVPDVAVLNDFMPREKCQSFIDMSEARDYEPAPITTARGPRMAPDVRNNERVIFDDAELSAQLYDRLRSFAPRMGQWSPVGLNERWRFYRYDPGQQFDWHQDGYYERENGERSFFTFLIYLNDDYEGGGTSFTDRYRGEGAFKPFCVRPQTGMALLFHHPLLHRGDPVIAGRKYVMRTDVMFERWLRPVR